MDFVHPLVVDKVDSSEVIVNEGELGAVLGEGREHARHPEEPNVLVRRRGKTSENSYSRNSYLS